MTNLFILALEPIPQRYTSEWYNGLPKSIEEFAKKHNKEVTVWNIDGGFISEDTTPGAFLNFADTNIWKNNQINTLTNHFKNGLVKAGDKILFTDAWHTGLSQAVYMSELFELPVDIFSLWHAGAYDPEDFLGRKVKNKGWARRQEQAFFEGSTYNFFATNFHMEMMKKNLFGNEWKEEFNKKIIRSGQPHESMIENLSKYAGQPKENIILFPHRLSPEKQLDIFKDLEKSLPQHKWMVCQENRLSKEEYHQLLAKSKMTFSASLQETFGISVAESILVDTIPLMPDRLSYSEIYRREFLYPSEWTIDYRHYIQHKEELMNVINITMNGYESFLPYIQRQKEILLNDYLNADIMYEKILGVG